MRIVFMGSPEFAVSVLKKIHESNHDIVGVVTVMDKPAGRGQKISQSAVKQYALDNGLHLVQPEKLKSEIFLDKLKSWRAELFVVVAFRMLPEVVWKFPPKGTINLHASLLPDYKGAAPINWAIINGEKETGVTTFFINEKIDSGEILLQEKVAITPIMNAGELHDQLMEVGASLVLKTIDLIDTNNIMSRKQQINVDSKSAFAPKIFKENCEINWDVENTQIHNFIRGLSPYPTAWCKLTNIKLNKTTKFKIFDSKPIEENYEKITSTNDGIIFPCATGSILVTELQPEGKRRMNFKEFLAGNDLIDYKT